MTIDAEVLSVTELLRPWEGQMVTFRNIADLRKQVGDAIDAAVACERERSLNVIAGENPSAIGAAEARGRTAGIDVLSAAINKFAPDLAIDLVERWARAKNEEQQALSDMLRVLANPASQEGSE